MRAWGRGVAGALAALLLGAAGPDPQLAAQTEAFLGQPDQIASINAALVAQASTLPFTCPNLALEPAGLLIAPPAPRFDADGTMIEGRVRLRFASSGCGKFRLRFNVWVIAKPGDGTRTLTALPGTTGAALELQQSATPTVTVAAGRVIGGCGSLDVIDTTDAGFDPGPAAGPGGRAWREVWLVAGCGMFAQVLLRFLPDSRGGATRVEVPQGGVRRVDVR